MGDRLECTEVWQTHHDHVTAEVPVTVSDGDRLDMFAVVSEDADEVAR